MIKKQTEIRPNHEILLFFVDKDFSEMSLDSDIYETSAYSIENFYVSDSAIKNILKNELGISEDENLEDLHKVSDYVIMERNKFIDSILWGNTWYSLQQRKRQSQKDDTLNLCDIKNYKKLQNIEHVDDFKKITSNYIEVTEAEMLEEFNWIKEDPVNRIRGKYFEQFMPKIFNDIFQEANKKKGKFFKNKMHVNIMLGRDNMISVFSQYADTPESLVSYLQCKFYMQKININHREVAASLDI